MRKSLLLGPPLLLLLALAAGCRRDNPPARAQSDVDPGFQKHAFDPFSIEPKTLNCPANERNSIIVYGQGSSPMAIYVFDAWGNCVAKDDASLGQVSDDLALEWYAPTQQVYYAEFRNLGPKINNAELAIR